MAEVAAPEGTTLLSGSGHLVTPTVARTAPSCRRSRQHQQLCADDPLRRCLKCPNSSDQLFAGLLHTDHRIGWIEGTLIDLQYVFHGGHKLGTVLGRNRPVFFQMRLPLV